MPRDWVSDITQVPTQQLMCLAGGFNHHWEPISKPRRVGSWGRRSDSRCGTCGKERTRLRNIHDHTAALYYSTPEWHVKVEEPFTAWDVAEELDRRLKKLDVKAKPQPRYRTLKAV